MGKSWQRSIVGFVAFIAVAGSCYACNFGWHQRIGKDERLRRFETPERRRPTIADTAGPLSGLPRGGPELRPVDMDALELLRRAPGPRLPEGSSGKPWLIRPSSSDGRRVDALRLDLDRDGIVDETWRVLASDVVERTVLVPATDGDGDADTGADSAPHARVYVLKPGAEQWVEVAPADENSGDADNAAGNDPDTGDAAP
jgi:hypothetical protein